MEVREDGTKEWITVPAQTVRSDILFTPIMSHPLKEEDAPVDIKCR